MFVIFLVIPITEEERQTFTRIYADCKEICYKIALKITKNPAKAEDAIQDAFFSIIKNKTTFLSLSEERRKAYIITTVKNRARNIILAKDEALKNNLDNTDETADNFDLCDIIESEEGYNFLIKSIKSLPLLYREVFELRYINDMKNNEISEALGISQKAVSKRIIKAKLLLREIINKDVAHGYPAS
ncbi:MAG: sigma-70 family RNA polymerase sigma factor [Defluviitaleaceae bacterium]|nr:sigma-70 family RNA polymerase sigma factor [Defluviitaleaceae bacterium]